MAVRDRGPRATATAGGYGTHLPVASGRAERPRRRRYGIRTAFAVAVGRLAGTLSRALKVGSGAMIGGRVTRRLAPNALAELARDKRVVLVTGTNGKTTTSLMIANSLRTRGAVAANSTGANMPDGHVAALTANRNAPYAVLEVDEMHLGQVAEQVDPEAIVLLNLSRDQLDRVGEIRSVERRLRAAVEARPDTMVVANADDPYIVSAAFGGNNVRWVGVGARWMQDALSCPRCGGSVTTGERGWHCSCGMRRPMSPWYVGSGSDEGIVFGPDRSSYQLDLQLPGEVNKGNAAFALAVALELGANPRECVDKIEAIREAGGRYSEVPVGGRPARLLLAKNPASWMEMLELVANDARPLVLVVNSQEPDGYDVSWLWDVEFELLAGQTVMISGERRLDLGVRLRYAEVDFQVWDTPEKAVAAAADGVPEVIANYSAFRDILAKGTR